MPPKTFESKLLEKIEVFIAKRIADYCADPAEARFQLLEASASRLGGYDLNEYYSAFKIETIVSSRLLLKDAQTLVQLLDESGVHPAFCLSALAREGLDRSARRSSGAYHTDFRLATHLAQSIEPKLLDGAKVIDPACGSGMLLVALSIVACGSDQILTNQWLRKSIFAADLSQAALRGARLSLSALTDEVGTILDMWSKWRAQDSLLVDSESWSSMAPGGFDIVLANPPWEKVKLTRHEYLVAKGDKRHYGSEYLPDSLEGYETAKSGRAEHAASLARRYPVLTKGEPDLYVAFADLLMTITRPGGVGALIIPAGLIRSMNTQALRRKMIESSKALSVTVMANAARHFSIDTRFKFLLVNYRKAEVRRGRLKSIGLSHAWTKNRTIIRSPRVALPLGSLKRLSPELTIPEVRTPAEWHLFKKLQETGASPVSNSSPWFPNICREIDMTKGRRYFLKRPQKESLPVVEGRMVQAHRVGCKGYLNGQGRRATWQAFPPGLSSIVPQFWFPEKDLPQKVVSRSTRVRAGFCDITGQTNERSMMASLIPAGMVCGNKVPTIEFVNDTSEDRLFLWLAIANSIPFDWLIRRVVTTTINYFVLLSIRLPRLDIDSLPGKRLAAIGRQLHLLDRSGFTSLEQNWRIGELRAEVDVLVAKAYGCDEGDLRLMLDDFPLLDRGQPALPGEERSTVTRDLLLSTWHRFKSDNSCDEAERSQLAHSIGATAYLSSEFASSSTQAMGAINEQ